MHAKIKIKEPAAIKLDMAIPAPLFKRLEDDAKKRYLPISHMIVNVIADYYQRCDTEGGVNIPPPP